MSEASGSHGSSGSSGSEGLRAPWSPATPYTPYGGDGRDTLYALLFADDGAAFRGTEVAFGPEAGFETLGRLAADTTTESRIRALAFRSLRALDALPGELPLLGVIVEVGLAEGLDVLAAYADGRVRYLNHAGGSTVIEAPEVVASQVGALLVAAEPVAMAIGPWLEARRPPPGTGVLRLSFLVGDELRFGEGPTDVLARDPMGGPVFAAASRLLLRLTELQANPLRHS